jgi:hypothetical protein
VTAPRHKSRYGNRLLGLPSEVVHVLGAHFIASLLGLAPSSKVTWSCVGATEQDNPPPMVSSSDRFFSHLKPNLNNISVYFSSLLTRILLLYSITVNASCRHLITSPNYMAIKKVMMLRRVIHDLVPRGKKVLAFRQRSTTYFCTVLS